MTQVHISDSVLSRPVDDQAVLLNLDTGRYFVLNGVAREMWSLLREGEDGEAIVGRLLELYNVEHGEYPPALDQLVEGQVVTAQDLRYPYRDRYYYRRTPQGFVLLPPLD